MDLQKRSLLLKRMEELCARLRVMLLRMQSIEQSARLDWMRAVLVVCEARYNRENDMIIFSYDLTFEEFLNS